MTQQRRFALHRAEPPRVYWGTNQGRYGYYCKECHRVIPNFEEVLIEEFLHQEGDRMRWLKIIEVYECGGDQLPDVEHAITQLDEDSSANSREHPAMLRAKQEARYDLRDETPGTAGTGPGAAERWCPHRHRRMTWVSPAKLRDGLRRGNPR